MGIKNLSKFLRDTCPDVFQDIHISEFAYKKVAVDTSLYMYHYKAILSENWLTGFVKLVALLRQYNVHCVFIYDTKAPLEKTEERKERASSREKLEERLDLLQDAMQKYHNEGIIDKILFEFQAKRKLNIPTLSNKVIFNEKGVEEAIKTMGKQVFTITPEDFALTRDLFDILDVPYFSAPMEAETMCSDLCIQGKVDAVMSEDTDVLAYGTPVFLTKINALNGKCVKILYDDVLEKLNFTSDEFLDFCVMCGTDYNKNIFRVGPKKAYELISRHSNIETISEKTVHDITILNHKRGRELFRGYEKYDGKITYCGIPKFTELEIFLAKRNIKLNMDSLKKNFAHADIVIQDDESKVDVEEEIEVEL